MTGSITFSEARALVRRGTPIKFVCQLEGAGMMANPLQPSTPQFYESLNEVGVRTVYVWHSFTIRSQDTRIDIDRGISDIQNTIRDSLGVIHT